MAPSTQIHILDICARTSSVSSIVVFYNANWTSPAAGEAFNSLAVLHLRLLSCNRVIHCSHQVIERVFG